MSKRSVSSVNLPVYTFEEAISLTRIGKFHYFLLLTCGFCFMSVMVETLGIGILMPWLKCDLLSSVSEQGMLASAGFLGVVLSSHGMGFLADTVGRIRTLRWALVLSSVATVISALSVNIWMMIVFRFLNGFFISGCQACVFSLCGEFHGSKSRVRHVTLLSGFMPIALIYLPSMALVILPLDIQTIVLGMKFSSWRILLLSNVVVSLVALIGLSLLPETPKYTMVQDDHDGTLEILRTIYAWNTGNPRNAYPVQRLEMETGGANLNNVNSVGDAVKLIWSQTTPLFSKDRWPHTVNISLIMFTVYGVAQGIFMWFPTMLKEMVERNGQGVKLCQIIDNLQMSTAESNAICEGQLDILTFQVLIVIGGIFTAIYLVFSFVIDYIGKKNLLICWLFVGIVCTTSAHWVSNFYVSVLLMTMTMAIGNCAGLLCTIAMEFFPTNVNAMGMCFIMMIGRLGAVTGSNIFGQILFGECDMVFWVMLGAISVLCVMGLFLPERKKSKNQQ